SAVQEQYDALKAFKEKCKSNGLIQEYDDLGDFKDKLQRQLALTVIRKFNSGGNGEVPSDMWQSRYLQRLPTLSEAARELLIEASNHSDGVILRVRTMGGLNIQTNGRNFIAEGSAARVEAHWEGAIRELAEFGLIESTDSKKEVYRVTDEGYRVA